MRYIVEFTLCDATKLVCITDGINKEQVIDGSVQTLRNLIQSGVVKGRKFIINRKDGQIVESWSSKIYSTSAIGGHNSFNIIAVSPRLPQPITTRVNAPGLKTAYNMIAKDIQASYPVMMVPYIYLYDNSQMPKKKSSLKEAEKTLHSKDETRKVLDNACRKAKSMSGNQRSNDPNLVECVTLMCNLVYDYARGYYREVPVKMIVGITAALLYFISPADLIPDVAGAIGVSDDVGVLMYALKCCKGELIDYRKWKQENPNPSARR